MKKIQASITGVHGYVPDDILSNADLEKMVDTNDEWIRSRTGVSERRILKGKGLGTSHLGTKAVEGLLQKTNTNPSEVDLLICATVTGDYQFPATANLICGNLDIINTPSFDIGAACSGFLYALSVGKQFIEAGTYRKVVIVGADKMSSITDYTDRSTCILFGDAAGAVLLEASKDDCGIKDVLLRSDGRGFKHLHLKAGGSAYPASIETVSNQEHYLYQEGKAVFKVAVRSMADISREIMDKHGLTGEDIAWLVPHQANKRIIDATARRMDLDPNKVMLNIHKYGNTTAATIPLCLWEWENQLNKYDNIILAAFGGGFTWGSAYIQWAYDGGNLIA